MWNDRQRIRVLAAAAVAIVAGTLAWMALLRPARSPGGAPLPRHTRAELELQGGVLHLRGRDEPFSGLLVEDYAAGVRKLEIEIHEGKAHGRSRGWHENGKLAVDETFVRGVSHGMRTRWHPNGQRRSVAQIEGGKVVGQFVEWHDNGRKAVEMTLVDGKPDGLASAWHPSGRLRSETEFDRGRQVRRQFWEDAPTPASGAGDGSAGPEGDGATAARRAGPHRSASR